MSDWAAGFAATLGLRPPDRVTAVTSCGFPFLLMEWGIGVRADWIAVLVSEAEQPGILVGAGPSVDPRVQLYHHVRKVLQGIGLWPSPLSARQGRSIRNEVAT